MLAESIELRCQTAEEIFSIPVKCYHKIYYILIIVRILHGCYLILFRVNFYKYCAINYSEFLCNLVTCTYIIVEKIRIILNITLSTLSFWSLRFFSHKALNHYNHFEESTRTEDFFPSAVLPSGRLYGKNTWISDLFHSLVQGISFEQVLTPQYQLINRAADRTRDTINCSPSSCLLFFCWTAPARFFQDSFNGRVPNWHYVVGEM